MTPTEEYSYFNIIFELKIVRECNEGVGEEGFEKLLRRSL